MIYIKYIIYYNYKYILSYIILRFHFAKDIYWLVSSQDPEDYTGPTVATGHRYYRLLMILPKLLIRDRYMTIGYINPHIYRDKYIFYIYYTLYIIISIMLLYNIHSSVGRFIKLD